MLLFKIFDSFQTTYRSMSSICLHRTNACSHNDWPLQMSRSLC